MFNADEYSVNPLAIVSRLVRHRQLVAQLVWREIIGRYRGSFLGLAWAFFHPVLMLAVYTFVLGSVFKMRWGMGSSETGLQFALALFVGLIVHGFFAECLNRAPTLVLSNPSYVKKVVFPIDQLAWVALGSALFHTVISMVVLAVGLCFVPDGLRIRSLLAPLVIAPFFLLTLGVIWFLASTGVFVRDISQTVGVLTTLLLFLSPVLYPISAVPEQYRSFLYLNPMTFIIEQLRNLIMTPGPVNWTGLVLYALVGALIASAGFAWFQKTRRGFADVL